MAELIEIKGVGPVLAKACADNGYASVEQIAAAMLQDLVAVPGISEAKARLVIAAAQALLNDKPVVNPEMNNVSATPVEAKPDEKGAGDIKKKAKTKKEDKRKKKKSKKKDKKKKSKRKGKKS